MDKEYLITYKDKNGIFDFEWLESEDELLYGKKLIKKDGGEVCDALRVSVIKDYN